MIELQGVVVRYPGMARAALDGVSLEISSGETVALVGSSGSGKTTLLRTINALVPVDSGTAALLPGWRRVPRDGAAPATAGRLWPRRQVESTADRRLGP